MSWQSKWWSAQGLFKSAVMYSNDVWFLNRFKKQYSGARWSIFPCVVKNDVDPFK